jgi:hypothetical protein
MVASQIPSSDDDQGASTSGKTLVDGRIPSPLKGVNLRPKFPAIGLYLPPELHIIGRLQKSGFARSTGP